MRLTQIMSSDKQGGAEIFFARLSVALQMTDIAQQVIIRRGAAITTQLKAGGVSPVELPFLFNQDFVSRRRLRAAVDEFSPDIVLTWMSRASVMCPPGPFIHVARLGGYYQLKYYRSCDHLIANTEDIARYLRDRGWPADRVTYLPNFVAERQVEAADRASMQVPSGMKLILALGRLHEDKAFDVLLKALPRVPDAHLWLAGDGPMMAQLQSLAASLGIADRVSFLGWRDDSLELLAAADCLVCPSRIEPLGNVVLEAWAHRRPVVAAASAGPCSLISEGETGLLAPVEDHIALAAALQKVLTDKTLAEKLADNGYREYCSRFSQAAVVRRYLDFFATVKR